MRAIAFIFVAMILGVFIGMWYASQDRTCAMLSTAHGNVVLCSNDYKKQLVL